MISKAKPWTPVDDELLRASIDAGEKAVLVAKRLDRTVRAVRRRAEVLKLSWKACRMRFRLELPAKRPGVVRWRTDEERIIEHLFRAGRTEDDISLRLDRTTIAVRTRLYKLGLKRRSQPGPVVESSAGADLAV